MKHFLAQNWGKASALLGLLVFVGLAFFPLIERNFASDPQPGVKINKEKDGWVSGMMEKDQKNHGLEIKSVLALGNRTFVGTKLGLYEIAQGQATALSVLPQQEVKHMGAVSPTQGWLATKMGLYLFDGSRTTQIYEGEVKSASLSPGKPWIIVSKEAGLLQSADEGKTWTPVVWDGAMVAHEHPHGAKDKAPTDYAKKD